MSADPEILARLDRIAELLERLVSTRQPAGDLSAADREVLSLLRALLYSEPWKRDRYFKAREALDAARAHPDLQARLAAALGPKPVHVLGKLLARVAGHNIDGAVVNRHSTHQGVVIWRVSRASGGDETHDTHRSTERRA